MTQTVGVPHDPKPLSAPGPAVGAAAFSAVVAVLGLITVVWWTGPTASREAVALRRPPPMPVFDLGEAARYAAITERPLFVATRRPAAVPQAAPAASAPVSTDPTRYLVLKGTVLSGGDAIAVVQDTRTQTVLRLSEGTDFEGWTLAAVGARDVRFEKDGRAIGLRLPAR